MRRILRFGSRKSIKKGKRKLRRANNHHWGIEWQILSATFNLHGFLVHIFHLFSCYCCHQMRFSRLFFIHPSEKFPFPFSPSLFLIRFVFFFMRQPLFLWCFLQWNIKNLSKFSHWWEKWWKSHQMLLLFLCRIFFFQINLIFPFIFYFICFLLFFCSCFALADATMLLSNVLSPLFGDSRQCDNSFTSLFFNPKHPPHHECHQKQTEPKNKQQQTLL